MNAQLVNYDRALRGGVTVPSLANGLCGRLIRGKKPSDFETLTDDPHRKIVMLLGADGLGGLLGKSGYDMLVEIGYTPDHIQHKVVTEGNNFKLVVFNEGGAAMLATWDNVVRLVADIYPDVVDKVRRNLDGLRRNTFKDLEARAGFTFKDVDKAGSSDPRFMTYERFRASAGTVIDARAFLYFTLHLRELFAGDGYTYTHDGKRGLMEYIVPNRRISALGDHVIIDIDVKIPSPGGNMPRTATQRPIKGSRSIGANELPLPKHFDPIKVGDWKWLVKYADRFNDALAWAKAHGIEPSSMDGKNRPRIALMPIDCQLTFCHPDFELYVGGTSGNGAIDDTRRLCEFIYRNLGLITKIHPTMDTHMAFQIFHSAFIVNEKGEHPDPNIPTVISTADVLSGKWSVCPKAAYAVTGNPNTWRALQAHFVHYAETLEKGGKYALVVWPFHAMLGGHGHALVPSLEEAIFFHNVARGSQADFQIKGGNPLTENYSVLRPEVLIGSDGKPIAQKNTKFLEALLKNDVVIIAGQAKSHCVAWTIEDLLTEIMAQDPALVKKVYLLEDCTSNVVVPGVVDFTKQGDDAFARFAAAGMHIVRSDVPMSDWPDMDNLN